MEKSTEIEFVVERPYDGLRLDRYLCAKLGKLSRTRVQQIIARDLVTPRLKAATIVHAGLRFRVRRKVLDEPETPTHFETLFLDEHLLVIDKPAGLPVHPSARYHLGTVVGRVRERYGEDFADPVHRLDRETSGVLVLARTPEALRALSADFVRGRVHKHYVAVCEGTPPDDFEVDAKIAEGGELVRIAVRIDETHGRPSRTRFVVQRRFTRDGATFALLRAEPRTGRQHQIRVHLKHAGFPMVGDKIYGPDEGYYDRFTKHCLEPEAWVRLRLPRQALHAAALELVHPVTRAPMRFTAPLPTDLAEFVEAGAAL